MVAGQHGPCAGHGEHSSRCLAQAAGSAYTYTMPHYAQYLDFLDRATQEDVVREEHDAILWEEEIHVSSKYDLTDEEIKKAYRKAALVHHPDRHAVAEENIRAFHTRRFKEIGEAYSVLGDPGKRALYDQGRLNRSIQAQFSASAAAAAAVHAKVLFWI